MVSLNEVPWLKNVLYTENGASHDTLLCYWYSRNFIKLCLNASARPFASIFQPDLEHEFETVRQFPVDGQMPFNFSRSLSYPTVSFLTVRPATVR